jgi:hypothetical protein
VCGSFWQVEKNQNGGCCHGSQGAKNFDFILAAILKILKTKSTTLGDDLFLCQVSKGSTVRSEFNIFCTLATMATAAILHRNPLDKLCRSCHGNRKGGI